MESHNETSDSSQALAPRTNQVARQGFGTQSLAHTSAITESLIAAKRADIEARWIMAMRMPRNLDQARQDIVQECRRPGFAEVAVYARPVGRKKNEQTGEWEEAFAEGLSIRFAEVAARCLGNISVETETVYDTESERRVRVSVTDLETNLLWRRDITVAKTVERKILKKGQRPIRERENSYGDRVFVVQATDDEVNVKEAAEISKAARTGILRIVPGHLQDEAMELCKRIAADRDAKDPSAARNRMFDAFANVGVKPIDIEQFVGHSTDQLSPAELDVLRKLYAAIADGEVTWADALADALTRRAQRGAQAAAPASGSKDAAAPARPATTSAPSSPPAADKKTGGKGAASVKDTLKKNAANDESKTTPAAGASAPKVAVEGSDPEAEPEWMEGGKKKDDAPPPPPLSTPKEGYEDRACAKCKVPIEVPKADPPGAVCYSCSQS